MHSAIVLALVCGCGRVAFDRLASDASLSDATPADADDATMVAIPAGAFFMGCNAALDSMCQPAELPLHQVALSGYEIDLTEVIQTAYQRCVDAAACTPPSAGYDPVSRPNHPVAYVTWMQAVDYCAFAGKRLPTEAEWEKAARGTDMRTYPWGEAPPTCMLANSESCNLEPVAVGSYPAGASPYGLLDMAGNVWEWVSDWHDATYYQSSPTTDPQGPASAANKGSRGGYFGNTPFNVRTARRGNLGPTQQQAYQGFRCARSF